MSTTHITGSWYCTAVDMAWTDIMKPPSPVTPDHGAVGASQLEGNGCWQGPAHARSASGAEEGARLLRLVEVGHPSAVVACVQGEQG